MVNFAYFCIGVTSINYKYILLKIYQQNQTGIIEIGEHRDLKKLNVIFFDDV